MNERDRLLAHADRLDSLADDELSLALNGAGFGSTDPRRVATAADLMTCAVHLRVRAATADAST